ncbi:MAG: ornithine carbamoyltransferase [Tissierellia bacterium]|nr:ornithine carbamoyltransferase [Tissierellia bacterium]
MISLKGRDFLTLKDFSQQEISFLLKLSEDLKRKKYMGVKGDLLDNKNVVLLFEKTSTRTRAAFEVVCFDEGANVTFLGANDSQFGKKESVEDTAKVLSRFYDGIEFRGFSHQTVEDLAKYSSVPVWNGLTDKYHPTQILADLLTIRECTSKPLNESKLVYVGDGRNNMANSMMIGTMKMGMEFAILSPKELFPDENLVNDCQEIAKENGGKLTITDDFSILKSADAIYTDVWFSMGEEDRQKERIALLKDYQVNMDLIKKCENDNVIFLHCLPAFHDTNTKIGKQVYQDHNISEMEVTDEVFNSKHSKVFDQAENRMHTIKAVMVATIGR